MLYGIDYIQTKLWSWYIFIWINRFLTLIQRFKTSRKAQRKRVELEKLLVQMEEEGDINNNNDSDVKDVEIDVDTMELANSIEEEVIS